jgi:uncharacterized protein YjbI with pentapeptide repeats
MQKLDIKRSGKEIREAAIQRNADNRAFYENNLKMLATDQNLAEAVIDAENPDCQDGFLRLEVREYKFTRFNEILFGKDKSSGENDLLRISGICFFYCNFSMCGFSNICFEDCTFVGCNFVECYTLGVISVFRNCSFVCRYPGSKSVEDMPSSFEGCEFTVKLVDCDVSSIVFNKVHFYFSRFIGVNMTDAIFLDCSFDTITLCGCDLRSAKLIKPKFIEFRVEDQDRKTRVDRKTFLDFINYNKTEEREIRFAVDVYETFSELFENGKIMDFSGEYFFLAQKAGLRNMKGMAKVKSFLSFVTCGYGERPSYSLAASMTLILVCGTLYMLFGVVGSDGVLVYRPTLANPLPSINMLTVCYHFSLVTFSTVGYGNVVPIGGSYAVSAIEMILGVVMVGIWVSTLVRKMTRN